MGRRARWSRAPGIAVAIAIGIAACGGGEQNGTSSSSGGGGGATCPSGQLVGADGACHPIGVQGCADVFVDADGLCRPTIERCKKGTIPKFDQGCVAVGIPNCAKEFVGSDGFCHVSASKCPAGTMALPVKGCVAIDGAGCGTGTWGDIPDGANVRYVDPTFTGASDGSKAAPFSTLNDALAAAPAGAIVALAAGVYHESAYLTQDIEIRGRCASKVRIDGVDANNNTIDAGGGSVVLRDLTLAGAGDGIYTGTTTLLDGVVIDGAIQFGVYVAGADVTIRRSLIENTRSRGDLGGLAVSVQKFSKLTITDSSMVDNHDVTVDAAGPSTSVTIDDVLFERTLPTGVSGLNGQAVVVEAGAAMQLSASALVANRLDAIDVSAASSLEATNIVVEATTLPAAMGDFGAGLELYTGGQMTVSGSAFLANDVIGLLADGSGTELTLDTTLVAGTKPTDDGLFGRGLEAQNGAHVTAKDSAFVDNGDIGVIALDPGTELDLDHVLVEGTRAHPDGSWGVGVVADDLALVRFDASSVTRSHVAGVVVAQATADIQASIISSILAGTIILQSPKRTIPGVGDGVLAMLGSTGPTIAGTRIEDCARAGVLFDGGSGAINDSSSTNNRFGVVLEGKTTASADTSSNDFGGNADGAEVDDAMLEVPDQPAALPQ